MSVKMKDADERFSEINWHPKFRRVPRNVRKVKIDKRFEQMFNDPQFKLKHAVDKRGRPLAKTSTEDLRRYYDLSSSGSESESDTAGDDGKRLLPSKKKETAESTSRKDINRTKPSASAGQREATASKTRKELKGQRGQESGEKTDEEQEEIRIDLARGEGNVCTSSSGESSSEWEFEDEDEELSHERDVTDDSKAPAAENATPRLAICNMDWERITARDLLTLLNSFKPPSGVVRSVKIYPSEFGLQRMSEEANKGPAELRELKEESDYSDEEASKNDDQEESILDHAQEDRRQKKLLEKLRQYELNRLKYYYAVADCDSAETAEFIYSNCDGMEYETSGTRLDLRFVPADMEFEHDPKDEAASVGDLSSYRPSVFVNKALQQSRPTLTWEEERDPKRVALTKKAFQAPEEWDQLDLNGVLASPSGSEESGDEEPMDNHTDLVDLQSLEVNTIHRKKSSLQDSDDEHERGSQGNEDDDDKGSVEMEIRWDPSIEEKLQKADGAVDNSNNKKLTQWQKYLERRKAKKRQRKDEARQKRLEVKRRRYGNDEDDDDLPSDLEESGRKPIKEKEKKKLKTTVDLIDDEETEREQKRQDELELLLASSDDENKSRHYNLKKLLKEKKKRGIESGKSINARTDTENEGEFAMNVNDPRFGAVYTSHLFNIDPSDPAYKKTPGMEELMKGKAKSKKAVGMAMASDAVGLAGEHMAVEQIANEHRGAGASAEVASLAKRVKAKTEMIRREKEQKLLKKSAK